MCYCGPPSKAQGFADRIAAMAPEELQNGLDEIMQRYAETAPALTVTRERVRELGQNLHHLATLLINHPAYVIVDCEEMRSSDGKHVVRFEDLDASSIHTTVRDFYDTWEEAKRLHEQLAAANLGEIIKPPEIG